MKHKELSVNKYIFLENTLCGGLCVISGIASAFSLFIHTRNLEKYFELISAISLICVAVIMFYTMFAKRESSDELSRLELYKAYYRTSDIMDILTMCILIVVVWYLLFRKPDDRKTISLDQVLNVVEAVIFTSLGLKKLLTGIIFQRQENGGDPDEDE